MNGSSERNEVLKRGKARVRRLKSLISGKLTRRWEEKDADLDRLRKTVREKNRRLRLAHEQAVQNKERLEQYSERIKSNELELEELRSQLDRVGKAYSLPTFFDTDVPVFFVLGQGKSGTTWLMNTLNSHPEVLCLGEGRFFEQSFDEMVGLEELRMEKLKTVQPSSLYSAIRSSEELKTWIGRSVWTDDEMDRHLENLNRLAVNYFLADRLAKTGKKIVGDKTTFSRGEVWREISTMYPEAKVIHPIRDGRDVAVSMIHHMWNHAKDVGGFYELKPEELEIRDLYRSDPQAALARGLFIEKRLKIIARNWAVQVSEAVEHGPALYGDNYMEIKYENLLDRPREEFSSLLRFLGADDSEEVVEYCIEANRFKKWAEGREEGQEQSSAFYRKGVAGDWQNVFTEKDKRIFKEVAGRALIDLGYEKNCKW